MFPIAHFIKGLFKNLFNPKISSLAFVSANNKLKSDVVIYRGAKVKHSSIGKYTYIGANTDVECADIGRFCSISDHCRIGMASHSLNMLSTCPIFTLSTNGTQTRWVDKDVIDENEDRLFIGNDVWIGSRVLIKGGITVGDGAVIGAGAVVVKDVPPYAIVGGVPAKVIRYRFPEETIELLENIKWWDFEDDILKSKIQLFQTETIDEELINELKRVKKC